MPKIELPIEHLESLKKAIQTTHDLDEFLNRAELSGRDISVARNKNTKDRAQMQRDIQSFFPNR